MLAELILVLGVLSAELGDHRFDVREVATHEFARLGELGELYLYQFTASNPDVEVFWRAQKILLFHRDQRAERFLKTYQGPWPWVDHVPPEWRESHRDDFDPWAMKEYVSAGLKEAQDKNDTRYWIGYRYGARVMAKELIRQGWSDRKVRELLAASLAKEDVWRKAHPYTAPQVDKEDQDISRVHPRSPELLPPPMEQPHDQEPPEPPEEP